MCNEEFNGILGDEFTGNISDRFNGFLQGKKGRGQLIPRLLQTVFYCIVKEEMWEITKKFKDPVIDFKKLRRFVAGEVKVMAKDLF